MADATRLRMVGRPSAGRASLGAPPSPEEARVDLAPEPAPPASPPPAVAAERPRIDGRTLRRSGRTVQFATRVSPAFDDRLRDLAMRDGVLLVEILERALDLYEASRKITENH
jgi:hypothetical protein